MCDRSEKSITFRDSEHSSKCFSRMNELRSQRKLCDVTIVFNDQRHEAHSIVLAACSEYFENKLRVNKHNTFYEDIEMDSVNSEALLYVLQYFYTGEIDIKENDVINIVSAASLLLIEPILLACFKFMEKLLNDKNCLKYLEIAKAHNATSLESSALTRIQNGFEKISKGDEFLEIGVNALKDILSNDHLNVSSENVIFESVKRWVLHDESFRTQHIISLMECVRFPFIDPQMLFDDVESFCHLSSQCKKMITETIQVKLLPNRKVNVLNSAQMKPRKLANTVIVVGSYNIERAAIVEIYDPIKNQWLQLLNMNINRKNFSVVIVKDFLVTMGGHIGNSIVNTVEKIDIRTGNKTSMPPMQTAKDHAMAVYIEGCIYVPGGRAIVAAEDRLLPPITTMEKYDFELNQWSYSTPMLTPRESYGVGVIGNEFYVVGGWVTGSGSGATEAFCPSTAKWRRCASMLVKRNWLGVTAFNGHLYAIGGRQGHIYTSTTYASLERYDPVADAWSIISEFRIVRYGIGFGVLGNKLITIGGSSSKTGIITDVDEFDPETRAWKQLSPVLAPRQVTNVMSVPISWLK